MTTRARQREAENASLAFQLVLAKMGVATLEEALALWNESAPANAAATATRWLDDAIALILSRRSRSRELAIAYYRLVRALRTGSTVADPLSPSKEKTITLAELRRQFRELIEENTPKTPPSRPLPVERWKRNSLDESLPHLDETEGDDDEVDIEPLDVDPEATDKPTEEIVRRELEKQMAEFARKRQERARRDRERAARDAAKRAAEDERIASESAASSMERAVLDAGRGTLYEFGSKDRRAIGYVRLSGTGNPCYFCAMLIARGVVYKSKQSAKYDKQGERYHTNCYCYAEPVFSKEEFNTDPRFAMNRELAQLWKDNIKGKYNGGRHYADNPALQAWRKLLRRKRIEKAREAAKAQAA